ncbi:MAG: polyribonucleotide nucleotidyltransferase [Chloroflexota bacterium]|nr:polyribonucleotide nucleotidyltransferase [Chloroflexota bacterium]
MNQDLAEFQGEIIRVHGKPKLAFEPPQPNRELEGAVAAILKDGLGETLAQASKSEREGGLDQLRRQVVEALKDAYPEGVILAAIEGQIKSFVRSRILEQGRRPDGRGLTDIRPISSEVGILPRTHGSGLFTRGETQVLTIATLGSLGEVQKLDGISPEETRRFMHHYNMPPFSNGEVKRIGTPGRREIGHGALVERALAPVIPNEAEFPYTIRLVSEVLSSNGSTSMASVCGSSLSLMDAGVPIKAPVAGAAMGLVLGEGGKHAILTDIIGMEDFLGDMDFKVAGTAQGITALQMDMKVKGITYDIIVKALEQARTARLFILDRMKEAIAAPRPQLNKYAPRMIRLSVDPDKIRTVIGPGGKTIRSIIQQYGVTVDVEDDGTVVVGAISEESAKGAIKTIEDLTRDVEVGSIYTGKVTRLMNFGAFVEILPGKEGLVHVSELAEFQVANPEEVVKVGDEVMVMVIEIDRMGRVNLSRRAVLEGRTSPPTDRVGAGDRGPQGGPPPRRFEERRPGPPGEGRFDRERRPGGPYRPQGRGGPPGGFGGRPQPRG